MAPARARALGKPPRAMASQRATEEDEYERALKALLYMREELSWTQEKIARTIDVSLRTTVRWLSGDARPSPLAIKAILVVQSNLPASVPASLNRRRRRTKLGA